MFYKSYNDQTGIDTGKYLKPLGQVRRHVNTQAYEVSFALLIITNTPIFQEQ